MSAWRSVTKVVAIAAAVVFGVGAIWFARAFFFSSASSLSIVRKYGFIAFVVGLLIGLGVAIILWWRDPDRRELRQKHGQKHQDT